MVQRSEAKDRRGRTWKVAVVGSEAASLEDQRFWSEELTPEERVDAVFACLLSTLKAQGIDGTPRLRRVSRRVQRKPG